MLIEQTRNTKNLFQIKQETRILLQEKKVDFSKAYLSYEKKYEWVDPTTTKKVFDEILKNISHKPEDVLIDCGSGLGYVLYLSSFHFNKTIGIEILDDIAKESKKNLISLMGIDLFQRKIEIIIGDILQQSQTFFDKGSIFFISSPFSTEKEFDLLIGKIYESVKRIDRNVYIIYYYPYFKNILKNYSDYFEFVKELNLIGDVLIYKHYKK